MKNYLRVDLLSWNYPGQSKPSVDVWFTFVPGDKKVKIHKKYNQKNNVVWQEDLDQKWLARQRKIDRETEIKIVKCKTDQDKAIRIMEKLKKEGWNVDVRSWDEWPQEFTIHASRKKKKVS